MCFCTWQCVLFFFHSRNASTLDAMHQPCIFVSVSNRIRCLWRWRTFKCTTTMWPTQHHPQARRLSCHVTFVRAVMYHYMHDVLYHYMHDVMCHYIMSCLLGHAWCHVSLYHAVTCHSIMSCHNDYTCCHVSFYHVIMIIRALTKQLQLLWQQPGKKCCFKSWRFCCSRSGFPLVWVRAPRWWRQHTGLDQTRFEEAWLEPLKLQGQNERVKSGFAFSWLQQSLWDLWLETLALQAF